METRLFHVLVDLGFADVLALFDIIEVGFSKFDYIECLVNLVRIDTEDTFAIDAASASAASTVSSSLSVRRRRVVRWTEPYCPETGRS